MEIVSAATFARLAPCHKRFFRSDKCAVCRPRRASRNPEARGSKQLRPVPVRLAGTLTQSPSAASACWWSWLSPPGPAETSALWLRNRFGRNQPRALEHSPVHIASL
eukprot:5342741-Pleurochrysis_carterae.AAC.4